MEFLKNQDMLMDIIDKTDIISKMKVVSGSLSIPKKDSRECMEIR